MPYKITVVGEISRLREGDAGSRNVRINKGTPGDRILTFNRLPTYLSELPPEVENDSMLVVQKVSQAEMQKAGGRLFELGAPEIEEQGEVGEDDDLEEEEDLVEEDQLVVEDTKDPDKVNKSNIKKPRRMAKRGRKA